MIYVWVVNVVPSLFVVNDFALLASYPSLGLYTTAARAPNQMRQLFASCTKIVIKAADRKPCRALVEPGPAAAVIERVECGLHQEERK